MKAFQTEYNDMMEQRDVKIALFFIHEELVKSSFADIRDVDKIRVISKSEVQIVTRTSIRDYELDSNRKCMTYVGSRQREDVGKSVIEEGESA